MSPDVDEFRQALEDDEQWRPDPERRAQTIDAAMAAFEKEFSPVTQGSGFGDRLKNIGRKLAGIQLWRRPMNTTYPHLKPYLVGGASLAVLSLAILNTQFVDQTLGPASSEQYRRVPGRDSALLQEPKSKDADGFESLNAGKRVVDAPAEKLASPISEYRNEIAAGPAVAELEVDESFSDLVVVEDANVPAAVVAPRAQTENAPMLAMDMAPAREPMGAKILSKQSPGGIAAQSMAPLSYGYLSPGEAHPPPTGEYKDQGRDQFSEIVANPIKVTAEAPVSTFSIDVDTASYSFTRAALNRGVLPQKDAVRVEELINYFPYSYAPPVDKAAPFKTHVAVMPTPWNADTKLLHIGIKGYELPKVAQPRSNLVFLIDTSGSMNAANKLPLLRNSFKLLLSSLQPQDTIAIVTYAGSAGMALKPTSVSDKATILQALDNLRSGGSTAGAEGIRQAYQLAEQNYDKAGVNRVILATDGDFNVGITDKEELKSFIERKRDSGVFLSVMGFGMGNYNDELMQTLAQNGNGNAAYIDSLSEARKVLVEEAGSTLFTIAKDVKIQIEFNPEIVSEYRLIGYETRLLKREDFNNDKVDAGDIGAGHSVTAIYEMTLQGSPAKLVDELRYGNKETSPSANTTNEYAFLKLRYKLPDSDTSNLITTSVTAAQEVGEVSMANENARFAASVAGFGQLLRGGRYTSDFRYEDVIALANGAKGQDPYGYRAEFISLVRLAQSAADLESLKR